jgi:hypothetical protein
MAKKELPVLFVGGWEDPEKPSGRKLSIASRTPHGVDPDGKIDALVPRAEDLRLYKTNEISLDEFRRRYFEVVEDFGVKKLAPGKLMWSPFSFFRRDDAQPVEAGDFVFCTCVKSSGQGLECHRLWAARLLVQAGWDVVLDGEKFSTD